MLLYLQYYNIFCYSCIIFSISLEEKLYQIQGYFAEKKGEREEMQDFHVLIDDFHKQIPHLHPSMYVLF